MSTVPPEDDVAPASVPAVPRRRLVLIAAVIALSGVLLLVYARWVGWAAPDEFETADAVVVHAGQRHRLRMAEGLMEQGVAPLLVILFPETFARDASNVCAPRDGYEVLCSTPERRDTVGEASEIGRLAEQEGWESVVIVTSRYHLRRAAYLDRKCSDVTIHAFSGPSRNRDRQLDGTLKEMVAFPIALIEPCE